MDLLKPLLPSCFRRRKKDKGRRPDEPAHRPGRKIIPGHGETVVVVVDHDGRDGNVALAPLSAHEREEREWIDDAKRSNQEMMERAGCAGPWWNPGSLELEAGGGRRKELLEAHGGRSRGDLWRNSSKVQSLPSEVKIGDVPAAKPWSPPRRVTGAGCFGPESDAAFLKAVIAAGKSGGEVDNASRRESGHWTEKEEALLRRQMYLKYYYPLQREEEDGAAEITEAVDPNDAAEVEQTESVLPADDPGTEVAECSMSAIEKNQGRDGDSAREVRNDDDYATRREFLKCFKFRRD